VIRVQDSRKKRHWSSSSCGVGTQIVKSWDISHNNWLVAFNNVKVRKARAMLRNILDEGRLKRQDCLKKKKSNT
jgi:hypothetical protein